MKAIEELSPQVGTSAACRSLSVARATHYRHRQPKPIEPKTATRPKPPRSLGEHERQQVLVGRRGDRRGQVRRHAGEGGRSRPEVQVKVAKRQVRHAPEVKGEPGGHRRDDHERRHAAHGFHAANEPAEGERNGQDRPNVPVQPKPGEGGPGEPAAARNRDSGHCRPAGRSPHGTKEVEHDPPSHEAEQREDLDPGHR